MVTLERGKPRRSNRRRVLLGLLGLGLLVNSALLTELALYSRNTLDHKPQWVLGKSLMARTPVAVSECQTSRNLLARNRLNLAAWHGHQELLLSRVVSPERAAFRFRLSKRGYVVVEWRRTPAGFSGVRLSRHPDYPSVVFRADGEGRFLEQRPLTTPSDYRWHQCVLAPGGIQLDGEPAVAAPELEKGPGLFGLRGSLLPAEVDDFELWEGGQRLLVDRFRNDRNSLGVAVCSLLALSAATGAVGLLARRDRLLFGLLANVTAGALLGAALVFDYVFYSPLYSYYEKSEGLRRTFVDGLLKHVDPIPPPDLTTVPQFLEVSQAPRPTYTCIQAHLPDGRATVVNDNLEEVRAYRREHPKDSKTVLVLGTSQTWGEGARRLEDGMIHHLAAALPGVEILNAARQGSNSRELVQRYETVLHVFEPDLIVVNLGHNDGREMLASNLQKMAGWKPKKLFVLEANTPENPPGGPPYLAGKHQDMREVARQHSLPLADLHGHLKGQAGTGLLWWDYVHPTSYGHRLAGQFLSGAVRAALGPEVPADGQQNQGHQQRPQGAQ